MAQLQVDRLSIRYGQYLAVDDVSFDVREGEFVSLLGPSGCGKTTTLRCIAGLETASSGRIAIGGQRVADGSWEVPPNKRGVNMVFQSYAVWPHMTVFENVAYGLRSQRVPTAELTRRVRDTLEMVGLGAFEKRYGTELSGGQQQRLAVARAVVTSPRLLLFDEPLSNLDAGLRERMRVELTELQRRLGRTSVYVTHDQAEAMAMSDRVILMRNGRIVQQGTPRDLYETPNCRFAAEFVGNANLLPGVLDGPGRIRVGDLRLNAATPASGDADLLVCIRPENVQIAGEAGGENVFAAQVERVGYLGNSLSCEISAGGLRLRADLPAHSRMQQGASIHLRVDPANITLVPEVAEAAI
ncbi:ABC transporter ATP-binding protein [Acidisphaera sp. L21]|uniref:ABC transporter ATP-binding protein n=1 Tax=Acidisphaera sp. L21 TaxID=1641851 RepID=UPI00131DE568|nr:ABC transporter ATP-binding protein [Acidisphaera sp. L21]